MPPAAMADKRAFMVILPTAGSVSIPVRREHPSSEKMKFMEISYVRWSVEIQPDLVIYWIFNSQLWLR